MMKKTLVAAAVTAAALGTGGVAVATAGGAAANVAQPTTTASSAGSAADLDAAAATATAATKGGSANGKRAKNGPRLGRALHGTWVTSKGGTSKTTVTHDAIRGTASAVSATSITITAADKFSQTYRLTGTTKVRVLDATTHKAKVGTISSVHNGARVRVVGTGTSTPVATAVVLGHKK